MSIKTLKQRIALVAVTALTAGVFSAVSAPVANANIADSTNAAYEASVLNVAVNGTTGSPVVVLGANTTGNAARSVGLLYKDASSGTAQTATVLTTGTVVLYTQANTAGTAVGFTATGGTFSSTAGEAAAATPTVAQTGDKKTMTVTPAAATGIAVSWSTTTPGTYTLAAYASTAGANIAGTSTVTSGTLFGQVTVTVTASTAGSGTVSAAFSTCVTDTNNGAVASTADTTLVATSGSPFYIKYILRDSFLSPLSSGNLVVTATNGALLSIGSGVQSAGTSSTVVAYGTGAAGSAFDAVRVDQPTAGAPLTTTVTVQYNGVTVCTKTVSIRGAVDKMTIASVATNDLSSNTLNADVLGLGAGNYRGHFTILLTDSAGNIATPTAASEFSIDALTATTVVPSITIGEIATSISSTSQHRFTVGQYTCGPTAGSSTVKINFTNSSTGKITVTPVTLRCADNPYTYTVALDKAVYNAGDIATATIKFLDSKGNPANSVVAVGASQIIMPMMTLVTATGAANTLTDANGEIKLTYTVGLASGVTAGKYAGIVDFTALTAVAAVKATPQYEIKTGGDTTTNADVLKSIVALIASINKQIQALQKLILQRR
jgi:hypothetical protein